MIILNNQPLVDFRHNLAGRVVLDLARLNDGRLLVQLQVGVGKSTVMDDTTIEALRGGHYDLVVVACPTRQLIEERAPLRGSHGYRVVNIRPRPADRCGARRDAEWKRHERQGLSALGRLTICGNCPERGECYWPEQYGKGLQDAQIIYLTQCHLERSPEILADLKNLLQVERMLTLFDENNFVGASRERSIAPDQLERFVGALQQATPLFTRGTSTNERWLAVATMLKGASTEDLQFSGWKLPRLAVKWAATVQAAGLQLYGNDFTFIGFELGQLCRSPLDTRLRDADGTIRFAVQPYLGDTIIFSGTADPEFTRYRLGKDFASPFAGYRFVEPETRWYNIASAIGARKYFPRHAPQILDFFAVLVGRRLTEGKRPLLVVKKCFVAFCARGLQEHFERMGIQVQVVTEGWTPATLAAPRTVPLITFGMVGTNLFTEFDCAFCLSGYYVNEEAINATLQDIVRKDLRLPITIETVGVPKRRRARATNPDDCFYDTATMAQQALEFQEHNVVVQAVGRVRPFTRSRR